MDKGSRIYVAGHTGLVGAAIFHRLMEDGYKNLIRTKSSELDLRSQSGVDAFFSGNRIDYLFLAAAKVGGILANITSPAEFIYDNLSIQTNVISSACKYKVKKLLFLGSSCIYPRLAAQPMKEEYLLDGKLEPTNEEYAIAKIAGIKMCQAYNKQYGTNFISIVPPNVYGPGDNFDLKTAHVLSSLIRRFHEAKTNGSPAIQVWGSGKQRREFLYVEDLADACVFLMNRYDEGEMINAGAAADVSIAELAGVVREVVGYGGNISFDTSKPDGMPKKLVDTSRIAGLGWKPATGLREGIEKTYRWFLDNQAKAAGDPLGAGTVSG